MSDESRDVSIDELVSQLRSSDAGTRAYAAFRLVSEPTTVGALSALRTCLADADDQVRGFAAQSLATLGDDKSFEEILTLAKMSTSEARPEVWAAVTLARRRSAPDVRRVVHLLEAMSKSPHPEVREQSHLLLATLDVEDSDDAARTT